MGVCVQTRTFGATLVFLPAHSGTVLSLSALRFRRFVDVDVAHARKTFRIVATQKFN
jgi:hypothetical protein